MAAKKKTSKQDESSVGKSGETSASQTKAGARKTGTKRAAGERSSNGADASVASETASKTATPKSGSRKAGATKAEATKGAKRGGAAPIKLNERQTEFLKKIHETGEAGYEVGQKVEQRTIDALAERKLLKRGAKNKETGKHRYVVTKAGQKHLASAASSPQQESK